MDFSIQITYDKLRKLIIIAELRQGDQFVARRTTFSVQIKHLSLTDPVITMNFQSQNGELIVELIMHSLALLVEVSLIGADVVFSDYSFNLPSGRAIQISNPLPVGWTLSRAQKEIRICFVYDSYKHCVPL